MPYYALISAATVNGSASFKKKKKKMQYFTSSFNQYTVLASESRRPEALSRVMWNHKHVANLEPPNDNNSIQGGFSILELDHCTWPCLVIWELGEDVHLCTSLSFKSSFELFITVEGIPGTNSAAHDVSQQ
jgi:hypothetical protein